MCPLIATVEDAEAFVQAVKFPPRGNRSWGPYRARLGYDGDYFTTANDWTIACPQIETRGALDQLDEILALDGVDMVCFGPMTSPWRSPAASTFTRPRSRRP